MTPRAWRTERSWIDEPLAHAPVMAGESLLFSLQRGELCAFSDGRERWRAALPGPLQVSGSDGVVLVGEHAVTQYGETVHVYDTGSGRLLSSFALPGSFQLAGGAVGADVLYVAYTPRERKPEVRHIVTARSLPDGSERWSKPLTERCNDISVAKDVVCATVAGRTHAVAWQTTSGDARWRLDLGGQALMRPLPSGNLLLIGLYEHQFIGIDRSTGDLRWRARVPMPSPINCAEVGDGTVVSVSSRKFVSLAVKDGRILREKELPPGIGVDPGRLVTIDDLIVGVESDGVVFAVDADGEVRAHHDLKNKVPLSLPPRAAFGRVFVTDATGRLHVLSI